MDNETLRSIKNRRSLRSFEPEQLRDNELETIVNAGLFAPSAVNQQSWHFTVIQNKDVMKRMSEDTKEYLKKSDNPHFQEMSQRADFSIFHNAPSAILVSGDTKAVMPEADCAAAMQNILLAAESLGIGSCWVDTPIHVFNSEKAEQWKRELGIPEGYKPLHAACLGYKSSAPAPEVPLRKENAVNYIR